MASGIVGTTRFCSSRDMFNSCQYVEYPDHDRIYRACIFTCSSDGCNGAVSVIPSSIFVTLITITASALITIFCWCWTTDVIDSGQSVSSCPCCVCTTPSVAESDTQFVNVLEIDVVDRMPMLFSLSMPAWCGQEVPYYGLVSWMSIRKLTVNGAPTNLPPPKKSKLSVSYMK